MIKLIVTAGFRPMDNPEASGQPRLAWLDDGRLAVAGGDGVFQHVTLADSVNWVMAKHIESPDLTFEDGYAEWLVEIACSLKALDQLQGKAAS